MAAGGEKTNVLITVMTYPHPSREYHELVCTAGISESGDWVRLYPIDYRYRPKHQKFRKYQWIEVGLAPHSEAKDDRKESRRPYLDTISLVGEPLSTAKEWAQRRKIIDAMPHRTLNEFKALYESDKTSLGIVRPSRIIDLEIREADSEWKTDWKNLFDQLNLFGPQQKPLRKLPFTFHYVFECEDSEKPHTAMLEDWELGTLFLKEEARLGRAEKAAESVRKKFFDEVCREDKDTRFFMGTRWPYNVWLVLGVFWPPKQAQQGLF